jgi:hypothetical protein
MSPFTRAICIASFLLTAKLSAQSLPTLFAQEVTARLEVPAEEQEQYSGFLRSVPASPNEFVLLVDRSPYVQAALLYTCGESQDFSFVGASPVSTGKPGTFEHFLTPLGVFEHTLDHPDYRAEGTKNKLGFRGYGAKGMRVYDFGWQSGRQTWGKKFPSQLRLQMHATDPERSEPKLGTRQSKGCIRIHSSLNRFLDEYGILDADYFAAQAAGQSFLLTMPTRKPLPEPYVPGRYLYVVETERSARPAWSPAP